LLASLSSGGNTQENGESISAVFKESVSAANEEDIQKLSALKVIMPVANGQHFLQANFVNAPNFDDAQINLLNNLSEQVIWLKLGRTKITDRSMVEVAKCKHLTHLHLEHTAITDAGLAQLQDLQYLEYLNLFDTKITDSGIQSLAKLKSLKISIAGKVKSPRQVFKH
jgi:Leucine-rich repeat (LRR) protein